VRVLFGDTNVIAQGQGSYASRGASYGLMAVYEAAEVVRKKMARVAGELLEAPASDLVLVDGAFAMPDAPDHRIAVEEIARAVYHAPGVRAILPDEPALTLEGDHTWSSPAVRWQPDDEGRVHLYPIHGGGAVGAVVEVDIETGQVVVERIWIAHDAGRLINPAIVEGQVVGAVAQGLGGALMEQLAYDADGRMTSCTLNDYQLPNFLSVPPIEVLHLETPLDTPLGSKGVGEAGAIGTPTVLLSAVEDALRPLGARVCSSPLTPPRVLDIVDQARRCAEHESAKANAHRQ
jgi:carbon-monoxide dehydrogenase large subunit